jgi:predicted murein hydrolase (TIGR00659 family)
MFEGSTFWLAMTLVIYAGSATLHRRCSRAPLLNPSLLTVAVLAVVLALNGTAYQDYVQAVGILQFFLGTAVVALALPFHANISRLRGRCMSTIIALAAGSLTSLLVGLAIALVVGSSSFVILSLAPKSATAAVSMEISRMIGGTPAVTGVLTVLTGLTGAIFGPYVLDLAQVRSPEARGLAMGVTSHGIGTARAFAESEISGSFAGLGMVLNAVFTAVIAPILLRALLPGT